MSNPSGFDDLPSLVNLLRAVAAELRAEVSQTKALTLEGSKRLIGAEAARNAATAIEGLAAGRCVKCGMGPMRESCAYPEACGHPGRELAAKLNQAILTMTVKEWEGPQWQFWKPEDRFYHASDRTWWRMQDGRLVRAEPPDDQS